MKDYSSKIAIGRVNMKIIGFLFLLFSISFQLQAQQLTELWNGLRAPQAHSLMPKGRAPFQTAHRLKKVEARTQLVPLSRNEWEISKGWELLEASKVLESQGNLLDLDYNTKEWYNATVPGTVLTTLVNQGVYPDPYFGLNNLAIPDTLCRMNWWYRTLFELPQGVKGNRVRLNFNGINYRAEVFLNHKKLGNIDGAFTRASFDISNIVNKSQKNVLAVYIHPPYNPGIPHEQSMLAGQGLNGGPLSQDGPTFISSIGWDWIPGIRDRNIGIWQNVCLKVSDDVVVDDPQVITDLNIPENSRADIEVRIPITNYSNRMITGTIGLNMSLIDADHKGSTDTIITYSIQANESKLILYKTSINKPKLWWPNGYGPQHLYNLKLLVKRGNGFSDVKELRFGIRKLSYELMVNTPKKGNHRIEYAPIDALRNGNPLFDYVNRVKFDSVKNINIPTLHQGIDESVLKDLPDDSPVGPYLVIKVNGVRIFCRGGNWGMDDAMKRSSRERLEPYFKLQQEANFNIIRNWTGESTEQVFYDLCDEYGMLVWNDFWITTDDTVDPLDQPLFMKNVEDVVVRFRNHPSIAIWCPRNEGFAPEGIELLLEKLIAKEDPTRHYHGQSRFLNMGTSGPWGYYKDPSEYYTKLALGFHTEMGSFAVPTANTIRKFIAPEDLWPINDVWAYHDLHHTSQRFDDFMEAVDRYGKPSSMESFASQSQLVTYDAWRFMLESWNSKMWNSTTGLILWMSHPAWPSMIWQTYSYDYETPGSYFGSKKACEPLHIQMNLPDNKIVVVNTTRKARRKLTASVRYYNMKGEKLYEKSGGIDASPNSLTEWLTPNPSSLPEIYLVRLELKNKVGRVLSVNDYWKTQGDETAYQKLNQKKIPGVVVVRRAENQVEVINNSNYVAVAVKLNARDSEGRIILPAFCSDGYFNLLPNEKRMITVSVPLTYKNDFSVTAESFNNE